jgi:hypothetical protein
MSLAQLSTLARDLGFEVFHRGVPRWRVLLDIADELTEQATRDARNSVTRRLAACLDRAA